MQRTTNNGHRAVSGLLFEVPRTDGVVFAAAWSTLALTAFIATWLPARRAAHADPMEALRAP